MTIYPFRDTFGGRTVDLPGGVFKGSVHEGPGGPETQSLRVLVSSRLCIRSVLRPDLSRKEKRKNFDY